MDKERHYSEDINPISLREERRRTGRYVAAALAMCITLLGLYQAMIQHTPVVAGLFAPAIIMFLYVFWVLYTASKTEKDEEPPEDIVPEDVLVDSLVFVECPNNCEHNLTEVTVSPTASSDTTPILPKKKNTPKEDNIIAEKFTRNKLNRTYSIA